ncbi:MAG: enolase C-terminal domain-like protein [Thermoguttaceae bacterium]|jgi:O-succinylbenzoate synthase
MRIDSWEIRLLRIPLAEPFYMADRAIDHCDTVYVAAEGGGKIGWGEVAPGNAPFLTEESASGVFALLRDHLLPSLPRPHSWESSDTLAKAMSSIRGNRHAKGALDLAWQDLFARIREKPLWQTLGGEERPIEVGLTFDRLPTHEDLYTELQRARDEKFRRITIKIRPGWEVQAVGAARSLCPWPMQLQVDIEGAFSPNEQGETLFRIQDFMLQAVEQPFPPSDLLSHAIFQENCRVPLALDESLPSLREALIALDIGGGRVFCLKPARLGGLSETVLVHREAQKAGIACYAGFDLGTSVAYRHMLAAASLSGCTLPADWIRFSEVFIEEPGIPLAPSLHSFPGKKEADPPREWQAIDLWQEPGIGFNPDRDRIEKYTVDREVFA